MFLLVKSRLKKCNKNVWGRYFFFEGKYFIICKLNEVLFICVWVIIEVYFYYKSFELL